MRVDLEKVKELAERKGWKQAELARQMGLSRAYVSRLFSGDRVGGKELLGGLMIAFPDYDLKKFLVEDEETNLKEEGEDDV